MRWCILLREKLQHMITSLWPLSKQGYLIVMEGEKEAVRTQMNAHLKDLMVDSELYGLEKVHAYHAVWLNQLEQGWVRWDDQEEKLRFLASPHVALSYV